MRPVSVAELAEPERRGFRWFLLWAVAGALLSVGIVTIFSIGLVLLLPGGALLWLLCTRSRTWPESLGSAAGAGLMLLLVGFLHRSDHLCTSNSASIPASAPVGTSVSCGGLDAHPWLYTGGIVFMAAAVTFAIARRYSGSSQ
jgi:hypothetical protein